MNWAEFMDKWRWSKADYDGAYGAQCVDLFNYYNRDVVGAPFYWCDGASDLWNNITGDFYVRMDNTLEWVPQPGDVVIWKANGKLTGPAGHVAIATGRGDTNNFQSFDENWPLGAAAQEVWHTYDDVLGGFRPKIYIPQVASTPQPVVEPATPPSDPVRQTAIVVETPVPVVSRPDFEVSQERVSILEKMVAFIMGYLSRWKRFNIFKGQK